MQYLSKSVPYRRTVIRIFHGPGGGNYHLSAHERAMRSSNVRMYNVICYRVWVYIPEVVRA